MDTVPEPKRAIRNARCYGKAQSILVEKSKTPKLGKR